MCDITIRAYRPADIAYIVAGWNESLPNDPITEERFLQEIALDEIWRWCAKRQNQSLWDSAWECAANIPI